MLLNVEWEGEKQFLSAKVGKSVFSILKMQEKETGNFFTVKKLEQQNEEINLRPPNNYTKILKCFGYHKMRHQKYIN